MPTSAILLHELCKTYLVPEREAGMGAALRSLFHRRMQAVDAVDGLGLPRSSPSFPAPKRQGSRHAQVV